MMNLGSYLVAEKHTYLSCLGYPYLINQGFIDPSQV